MCPLVIGVLTCGNTVPAVGLELHSRPLQPRCGQCTHLKFAASGARPTGQSTSPVATAEMHGNHFRADLKGHRRSHPHQEIKGRIRAEVMPVPEAASAPPSPRTVQVSRRVAVWRVSFSTRVAISTIARSSSMSVVVATVPSSTCSTDRSGGMDRRPRRTPRNRSPHARRSHH
jgi:hypothetical protein